MQIFLTNRDTYRKITKHLRILDANFHTFQLKQDRAFRIVLRNIHHSVSQDELQTEFSELGHEAINISNIKHSITKNPLSLFYIDLNATNEEVYNIKSLMNSIVKIEPPHIKREVVECKRSQRYGHTQNIITVYNIILNALTRRGHSSWEVDFIEILYIDSKAIVI